MSEEDTKNNNTSSVDQVATVVAATNDNVSSSLVSSLVGDASSSVVSGGAVNSSTEALAALASAGVVGSDASALVSSLASTYSNAALSSLDQTYYAGSLNNAASFMGAETYAAALNNPPTQNASTYIVDSTTARWLTDTANMTNAATVGHANVYYANTAANPAILYGYNVTVGGRGTGLGNVIYNQRGTFSISNGGSLAMTASNQFWVTNGPVSSGNLKLEWGSNGSYRLALADSAYFSATGYLGGIADKSDAGQAGVASQRTGALSTGSGVVADVGGDWGTVGDYRTGAAYSWAPATVIGSNNKFDVGGNIGVFTNGSVTAGDDFTTSVATVSGSGFFVGSGGLYTGGSNGNYYVHGGMGAAYSTAYNKARLILGNNNSVFLDQANWGNFAAQAGGVVSVGDSFHLSALELSVGYGQDPNTGAILGAASAAAAAVMTIGNNASIILGQKGLKDNGSNFYLGSDGAIVIDASGGQLNVGTGANIQAGEMSIGNFAKDYSGINPQTNSAFNFAWYQAGSNNTITIGSGATINLSGGIALDGVSNTLALSGGGLLGNELNAGYISAGNFYKQYNTSVTGGGAAGHNMYAQTSVTSIYIGDGYQVNLSAGNFDTGLTNIGTLSNTGNITLNQVLGVMTFGSGVHVTANSVVLGDYSVSSANPYNSGIVDQYSAATSNAVISFGNQASMNLSGAVMLNGANNSMVYGDSLILNAATYSMGSGVATPALTAVNNHFSAGINANITFSNGFIDSSPNGIFALQDGGKLNILTGNLLMNGSYSGAGNYNWFQMNNNGTLVLGTGSIIMNNAGQQMTWGTGGTMSAVNLSVLGTSQAVVMGTDGTVNLTGDYYFSGALNSATFGAGTDITVGGNMNFVATTGQAFSMGTGDLIVGGAYNLNASANTITIDGGIGKKFSAGSYNITGDTNTINIGNGTIVTVTGEYGVSGNGNNITIGGDGSFAVGSYTITGNTNSHTIGAGDNISVAGDYSVNGSSNTLSIDGGILAQTISVAGNYSVNGDSNIISTAANETITITSNYTISGLTNSINYGTNTSMNVGGSMGFSTSSQIFSMGTGANISVTGDYSVVGDTNTLTLDGGGTFNVGGGYTVNGTGNKLATGANETVNVTGDYNVSGSTNSVTYGDTTVMSVGGSMSFATSSYYSIGDGGSLSVTGDIDFAGTTFKVGNVKSFTANDFNISSDSPTVTFGSNIAYAVAGWNLNGVNNKITLGDGATGSLGDITVGSSATGASFDTGVVNGTVEYGTVTLTNDATFTMNGTLSGTSIIMTGANTVNFNGTGNSYIIADGLSTSGAGATISIASGNFVRINGGDTALELLGNTNFTIGSDSLFNVSGNITIGMNASSSSFVVGDNVTFKAANIVINATTPSLTFGLNTDFTISGGWAINSTASGSVIKLGDGATGSLGDIRFSGAVTGATFDTGNSGSGLTFGTATIVNDNVLTLGNVTGTAVSLSNTAVLNIDAGATANISTLTMDGSDTTGKVTVNVGLGATLNIDSIVTTNIGDNMPTININGGTVIIAGEKVRAVSNLAQHAVNFNSVDNGIYQYEGDIQDASGRLTINNFALTDKLIFQVSADYKYEDCYRTSYDSSTGILTITYITPFTGVVVPIAEFYYTPASAGQALPNVIISTDTTSPTGYDLIITQCFLTGTHLLTPEGEVTVENLKAGDQVITLENGQQVSKAIVWAGNMEVNVNHYENKGPLYPVRIKAHAFGLNQPCRDLLVTPEHTIYVDGGLIPARMLVNGRSIIVDTTIDKFTVYHIETEKHSILFSENLTTESYLNTDNRHMFKGDVANLNLTFDENADHQSWENDAAAPLTVARHQVEPIWQRLDRRAAQQGYAPVSKPELTRDANLCLITQKGEKLQPVDVKGNTYSFYVPANVCVVAMHSKAALPSEVVGPFLDDRRMLGVLVAKISVFGERAFDVLPADMTGLSGWHSAELNRTDRWTKGLATLPEVVSEVSSKVKLIKIELTATSEYFVDTIEFAEKIA